MPAARLTSLVPLLLAAALSCTAVAAIPHEGLHPLALLAALLPLQLAALLYVFAGLKGAGSLSPGSQPPASVGSLPAGGSVGGCRR